MGGFAGRGALDAAAGRSYNAGMESARLASRQFRGVLFRSIFVPLVLMLLLAGTFVWQIGRLIRNAAVIEQSDRTIAELNRMEKLHVDLETGLRGFLLTGQANFLEPYRAAQSTLAELDPTLVLQLREPKSMADRYGETIALRRQWIAYAERQMARREANDPGWQTALANGEGKVIMDAVRERFGTMIADESALRTARNAGIQRSTQRVVLGGCLLATAAGLVIAYYSRQEVAWLGRTFERSLRESRELSETLERRVEERTAEVTRGSAKLAEANKELEAFAYSISHDLRAPMRHITGFANLVRLSARDKLSGDDVENLDTIRDTAVLAGRMVDDLLAFSRVGRTQLRRTQVDMNQLVKKSIEDLAPELVGRQVEWAVADLPPAIGDPALLKMVWQNLLANAVKYTGRQPAARIEVGASTAADGATTYIVRDNGVGFDMKYAHKLFGVFQRLHRAEEFEGTGIGLANVRRIILRHDGEVSVEGKMNEGATFSFRLPQRTTDVEGTA